MEIDQFLNDAPKAKPEAKYNLFNFQHHLLEWISISAGYFHGRKYAEAAEALNTVYSDAIGYVETDELEKASKELEGHAIKYRNYVLGHKSNTPFTPPITPLYRSYVAFRKLLMKELASKQLLIPKVDKSGAGALDQ